MPRDYQNYTVNEYDGRICKTNFGNNIDTVSIVALPDYVVKALKSKGIDIFNLFNTAVANVKPDIYRGIHADLRNSFDLVIANLKQYISKNDIRDIYLANRLLDKQFGIESILTECYYDVLNLDDSDAMTDFIQVYVNSDRVKETINMSMNNAKSTVININVNNRTPAKVQSDLFRFEKVGRIVFVIFQDGFTNFINYNISKFKFYFIKCLLNYMFTHYDEELIYEHKVLDSFINYYYSCKVKECS